MALAPTHLCFPVLRQNNGEQRLVAHENAIPEVYDLFVKVRKLVKAFMKKLGKEANLRELEMVQRRIGDNVLVPLLDSSSEWSSSFVMLQRIYRMKPALTELAATRAQMLPRGSFLTETEWLLVHQVIGCLRPFKEATDMAQRTELMGSMVLPIAYTLEHQLRQTIPIRVPAGDREGRHSMPMEAWTQGLECLVPHLVLQA